MNTSVFESREMNQVSSTPHEYAKYANAQNEIDVPEYFNLPNLIKVSKLLAIMVRRFPWQLGTG